MCACIRVCVCVSKTIGTTIVENFLKFGFKTCLNIQFPFDSTADSLAALVGN